MNSTEPPDHHKGTAQWTQGTEVVALYNFKGSSSEDLTFKRGEVLTIIKATRDQNWYYAKHPDRREGMIPANYVIKRGEVRLSAMPWFHGKMDRKKAEDLLTPKHEDGYFLVRESVSYQGDYTLSVYAESKVEHYRILFRNNKLTIDEEGYFENLTQLVEHYEKDADGLCTRLKKPVEKHGKLDYSVDKKMFEEQGWVIKAKDIRLGDCIGRGDFANVYKAEYLPNRQQVAVKQLKDDSRASQVFLSEASVMTSLQHPNLVQLMGIVLGQTIQILTEYMAKGSLVEYLRSRGRTVITKENQINFASDTSRGMAYLESKNIVHRDLAARNVLINDDCVAKVSDFGLARPVDSNHDGGKFPIKWTAPEALKDSKFTNKSDLWSFGILLWEIYTFGRVPYPRIPLADVVSHIENGYRMERPDGCPEDVYKVMQEAWTINPAARPTFQSVTIKLDHMRATTV